MSDWIIFNPDYNKPLKITVFDDGNSEYTKLTNIWFIFGEWRGKVRLINIDNTTIINSISEWKTQAI